MRTKCISLFIVAVACSLARAQTTPLAQLIAEADGHNSGIRAAQQAWQAATHAVAPASTLPDPEVSLQQMTVGSPLPFAGYSTSNFAYTGVGVSQAVPFPGKLRLRGQMARNDADASHANVERIRRRVEEQVKEAYIELAYLQETGNVLERDQQLLRQIERLALERYATGQITQGEVLAAQLEQTNILRDIALQGQQAAIVQAHMRALLGRGGGAPAITAEPLKMRRLASSTLPPLRTASDPNLAEQQARIDESNTSVQLAHKNFLPDFTAQYMYQRTGSRFPDYYQWTVGMSLPIHESRRQKEELAGAVEERASAASAYQAAQLEDEDAANQQWISMHTDEQMLDLYRGGLLPQANARLQAAQTAFQSNRASLQPVLDAYRARYDLEQQYWHTLADHETALAKLEQIAGPLPLEASHE
ncbi:MAG TPA: TolC family protein [Terriglobales bacterium]|nr:TolC family protein [Terriglobales bacterium]